MARHPEIGRIVAALRQGGASQAAMSGSGSAVFGLFATRAAAGGPPAGCESRSRRTLVLAHRNRMRYQALAALEPIGYTYRLRRTFGSHQSPVISLQS